MYRNRELSQDISLKDLIRYPTMLFLLLGFYVFIFLQPSGYGYDARKSFNFLLYPFVAILIGISLKDLMSFLFIGKWVKLIGNSFIVMANGSAVFLFFFHISETSELKFASSFAFTISLSIIIFRFSKLFESRIIVDSLIKAGSYLLAGVSVSLMFRILWPIGFWDIGIKISLGDIVFFSFLGLAVMQLVSLIDLTGSEKAGSISSWLKSHQTAKLFTMLMIFYLLYDLRGDIVGDSILAGWIFIFVILLIVFVVLILKIKNAVGYSPGEKLGKHFQNINYNKIKDITNISKYINDFIEHGSKTEIVSCLFYMACKSEISIGKASKMIVPLLEYKDIEYPGIATRKSFKIIEERNRQKRTRLLEVVISNFEYYGKGVRDINEFGEASDTL